VAEGWLPDFSRRQEREMGDVGGHDTVLSAASWPERNVGDEAPFLGDGGPDGTVGRLRRTLPAYRQPEWRSEGQSPEGARRMVQAELSLDSVRVVRNDLSADDLELVPRAPGFPATGLPVRRVGGRLAGASGGWRGWLAHWRCFFRRRAC
jgi:hypothetical protein